MDVVQSELTELRAGIAGIDKDIVVLLRERQRLVCAIGEVKQRAGLVVADPAVEQEKMIALHAYAEKVGLAHDAVAVIFPALFAVARQQQEKMRE